MIDALVALTAEFGLWLAEKISSQLLDSSGGVTMGTRIAVLGGSNSLLKGGWVDRFEERYSESVDLQNLSIGASTSAMGLFRYLSVLNESDGRLLVWEYSLNEENYFKNGQGLQPLIRHVEWILQLCAREGRKFLAVLLYTKEEEERSVRSEYREKLKVLFERYQVQTVDAGEILRQVAGTEEPDWNYWYKENAHYSVETPFLTALADAVFQKLIEARCPLPGPIASRRFHGRKLTLCYPLGENGLPFKNRVLSCTKFPIVDGVVVPAVGNPIACILVTSNNAESALIIAGGKRKGPYSTQISGKPSSPKFLLKHIILWNSIDDMLEADHEVRIVDGRREIGDEKLKRPIRQNTFCWEGWKDVDREDGVVALLVEGRD